jgi:hypothetical protein
VTVLLLKLRQAETAMSDGRLDEAFDLLVCESLRVHHRGQKAIGDLTRRLVERGRAHLEVGRFRQAMLDCDKAERLAGLTDEVAALRTEVSRRFEAQQHQAHREARTLAAARGQIDAGRLSRAEQILSELASDHDEAADVRRHVANQREDMAMTVDRVEQALRDDDILRAARLVGEGVSHQHLDGRHESLIARVRQHGAAHLRRDLTAGRLDRARALMEHLQPLVAGSLELEELRGIMRQCQKASDALAAGRLDEAGDLLHRLRSLLPDAQWIDEAAQSADAAGEQIRRLYRSPFGALWADQQEAEDAVAEFPGGKDKTHKPEPPAATRHRACSPMRHPAIDLPLIMQIDGVGGFIVMTQAVATLGPISGSSPVDLPLVADPTLPRVTMRREDDAYWIEADRQIIVDGRPTRRTLLRRESRIELSPRCRMRFEQPHPASTTATLTISGARLLPGDVRRVLLVDRELIVANDEMAHVRAEVGPKPIILTCYDRQLAGPTEIVHIDGKAARPGELTKLPIEKRLRVGPLSMILTPMTR